ncbi:hypothetical protein WN48_09250 [Eufriesea mexicana]|nr:hypothetical protein WN48_09250 [Eufriesea mexicana]
MQKLSRENGSIPSFYLNSSTKLTNIVRVSAFEVRFYCIPLEIHTNANNLVNVFYKSYNYANII